MRVSYSCVVVDWRARVTLHSPRAPAATKHGKPDISKAAVPNHSHMAGWGTEARCTLMLNTQSTARTRHTGIFQKIRAKTQLFFPTLIISFVLSAKRALIVSPHCYYENASEWCVLMRCGGRSEEEKQHRQGKHDCTRFFFTFQIFCLHSQGLFLGARLAMSYIGYYFRVQR